MKYTISIADDEPRVRKGLQSLISARGADWEVCGLYHDGKTALAAAGEQRFDVLLADIRMPGMDGLELASALRAVSPETVVVVMSGYKEFDYARRAMKIGVLDFLVKPIEEGELFGVLDRARREIERRKTGREEIPSLAGPDNTGDALFEEVLSPTAPAEAQEKLFAFLGLSPRAIAALAVFPVPAPGQPLLSRADIESALSEQRFCFVSRDCLSVLVTGGVFPAAADAGADAAALAGDLASDLCRRFPQRLRVGVSREHSGPGGVRSAFQESVSAAGLGYYDLTHAVFPFPGRTASPVPLSMASLDKLTACLVTGIRSATEAGAREYLHPYQQARAPLSVLDDAIGICMKHVQDVLSSILPDKEGLRSVTQALTPALRHGSFQALESEFARAMGSLSRDVEQANQNRLGRAVRRAVHYIEENFGRDLPLEEVAKSVGLSPSYFSSCFKKETGRNVVEYITEYRVEKAIEMLCSTNLNTSEVAYQVGFNDPKYFARIFKKSVGVTPSLYRKYSQEK